jgi:hypothetical protein
MSNLKAKFITFVKNGYFLRVDPNHKLNFFIGLDENGRKTIKFRGNFIPKTIKGTNSIDVSQYKSEVFSTIIFSLNDEDVSGLFYKFCDDLIESSRSVMDDLNGYLSITNRFFQWKKMFLNPKNEFLTEQEIMGLIGEITFLNTYLFNCYGKNKALEGWSGQDLTHKDFSYGNIWFEVKTINGSSSSVKISSMEQLDSEYQGELVVYRLEKMSPAFKGITLNSLVSSVYNQFESEEDRGAFLSKVSLQGFSYNDYYDDFVFEIKDHSRYDVCSDFPKLTRRYLPEAVCKTKYELSLVSISNFKI